MEAPGNGFLDLGGESYRTDVFRNECDVQLESMNNTVPLFSTDVSSARKSNKRTVKGCERNSDSNVYSTFQCGCQRHPVTPAFNVPNEFS